MGYLNIYFGNPHSVSRFNGNKPLPIDTLKRIVEQLGYSAISVYDDSPHAVLRKFNKQLTVDDCEPSYGYNCTTYIYTSRTAEEEKQAKEREADERMNAELNRRKAEENRKRKEEARRKVEQENRKAETIR